MKSCFFSGENGCSKTDGGCSHLCINRPTGYVCMCPIGMELSIGGRDCVIPEAFLLYSRGNTIRRISLGNHENEIAIPLSGLKAVSAIDYDVAESRIYWTDTTAKVCS